MQPSSSTVPSHGEPACILSRRVKSLSRVQLFATPWAVGAYYAPPSMGFSRQEYWSGLPFPSPEVFQTQGLNPGLQHCRQTLYRLSHQNCFIFLNNLNTNILIMLQVLLLVPFINYFILTATLWVKADINSILQLRNLSLIEVK